MAYYPKENPAAKHDLLCPTWLIDTLHHYKSNSSSSSSNNDATNNNNNNTIISTHEALASTLLESARPQQQPPDALKLLSTIYTYPDAPTKPKPLSRAPRIWKLMDRSLFLKVTRLNSSNHHHHHPSSSNDGGMPLKQCKIAVKLPSTIRAREGDTIKSQKDLTNSKTFRNFIKCLHHPPRQQPQPQQQRPQQTVAILACDSAGRIGFVVPVMMDDGDYCNNNGNDSNSDHEQEEYYAAHLYYAPMKEFIAWSGDNYTKSCEEEEEKEKEKQANGTNNNNNNNNNDGCYEEEQPPETWTPQYTPPREEDCKPCGWDTIVGSNNNDTINNDWDGNNEPVTWTPQYTPPREEECIPRGWDDVTTHTHNDDTKPLFVPSGDSVNGEEDGNNAGLWAPPAANGEEGDADTGLWAPPSTGDDDGGETGLWAPPTSTEEDGGGGTGLWAPPTNTEEDAGGWDTGGGWDNTNENETSDNNNNNNNNNTGIGGWITAKATDTTVMKEGVFHVNAGAAASDAFYSGLTRSLGTRADSQLYHMRSFNGWVKATQIAELDPDTSLAIKSSANNNNTKQRSRRSPMRVLDLACGKGGDLGKWALHQRGMDNYVGVDVARGSLIDAAIRARQMSGGKKAKSFKRCTFTLADLGEDVPGRKRSKNALRMQELLTWSIESETSDDRQYDPKFAAAEGGGISESDKFDVVSIQFAIHYMMQTRKRARRFFHTVSSLLEIGGNLIATTIDARVVVEKLMGLGMDLHFDDMDMHSEVDLPENEERHHNGNKKRKVNNDEECATVKVGKGVCRLKFDPETLQKVFQPPKTSEDMFGLQYTFTLVEGSDHAAGVGEAVDLPEWLTPIPALKELASEAGLDLEYATNFHTFFEERKDPAKFPAAHNALYNMKVLNRSGSISEQEWEVSRMYIAVKFRKVRESMIELGDEDVSEAEMKAAD